MTVIYFKCPSYFKYFGIIFPHITPFATSVIFSIATQPSEYQSNSNVDSFILFQQWLDVTMKELHFTAWFIQCVGNTVL